MFFQCLKNIFNIRELISLKWFILRGFIHSQVTLTLYCSGPLTFPNKFGQGLAGLLLIIGHIHHILYNLDLTITGIMLMALFIKTIG